MIVSSAPVRAWPPCVRTGGATLLTFAIMVGAAHAQQPATPDPPKPAAPAMPASPSPAPNPPAAATPAVPATPADKQPAAEAPSGTPATVIDAKQIGSVLGRAVQSPSGEDMGHIVDILADHGGTLRAAVIDFGGFFGVGSRKIAVDWKSLHFMSGPKGDSIVTDLPQNQLRASPVYKEGEPVVVLGAAPAPQAKAAPTSPAAPAPVTTTPTAPASGAAPTAEKPQSVTPPSPPSPAPAPASVEPAAK